MGSVNSGKLVPGFVRKQAKQVLESKSVSSRLGLFSGLRLHCSVCDIRESAEVAGTSASSTFFLIKGGRVQKLFHVYLKEESMLSEP